ncbi:MAG: hypothetical protein ABSG24_10275 [Acidimicrobiales bacterium]
MKRVALLALVAAVFAWWASGVTPFTTLAYILVAVATVCVVVNYVALGALSPQRPQISRYYQARAEDTSFRRWAPWMGVVLLALTLEIVGLSLGGRSATVPTVSTMLDPVIGTIFWFALLAACLSIEVLSRLRPPSAATLVQTCDMIATKVLGRCALLFFWAFVGLHLFTRYTLPGH